MSVQGKLVEIIVVNNATNVNTHNSECIKTVISQINIGIKWASFQTE